MAWLSWDKMCLPKEEGGLDFRDLKAFNHALSAKQGWRLQTNTTSLVHKVFKEWYFLDGDFLSAKLGSHPSFAWRSILAGQKIVQKMHRWQVENGQSLHIWRDKWLTKPSTFKITSSSANVPHDAKVSLLIDPYTWAWRADMVQQFFSPIDAFAILSIPLNFRLPCDQMVQAFTPKGDFTVRSAYKLALEMEMVHDRSFGEASNNRSNKLFWKTIWRLNVPDKVKSFAWRASNNIISTKANLCH